ncbi:MAG: hypothetical protein KAR22_13325, partial [Gammaproteobacteria bacterium]|nr:hypothetical protein [Gammaproteobacteria bacterium]
MTNRFVFLILIIGLAMVTGTAIAGNPYAWGACCSDTWRAVFAGTRANSMGQADIAGANGPDALFLNAAPLAGTEDVAVSWDRWGSGTDEVENLALAVGFGALRLGVCRSADHADFGYLDPVDYGLPPGTPLIADRRTMYYGLGLDLGASLFKFENLRWMVGGVARRFEQEFQGSSYDRSGYDLGTTLERSWRSS